MHTTKIDTSLIWSINRPSISCVLEYLSVDDLKSLAQAFLYQNTNSQSCMMNECDEVKSFSMWGRLAKIQYIFKRYFNHFDRSYFFNVYGQHKHMKYESQKLGQFALSSMANPFFSFQNTFNSLIMQCSSQIHNSNSDKLGNKINKCFADADLSLPKLMRESVCSDVNSPFQYFLLEKSNPDAFMFLDFEDEYSESIRTGFQQQEQNSIMLIAKYRVQSNLLALNAHNITSENYRQFRIEGFSQHNFMLVLLAITEKYLSMIQCYANSIEDKFELMLELSTRYSFFVNTIISIEESFGRIFKAYAEMYNEIYSNKQTSSSLSYWKSAMSMWSHKMGKLDQKTNQCYMELVKQQLNSTINKNKHKVQEGILVKVEAAQRQQELNCLKNSQVYEMMHKQSDEISMLVKIYQEYLVDSSVNEISVNSCGHSQQNIGSTYLMIEKLLVKQEKIFLNNLKAQVKYTEEIPFITEYLRIRIGAAYKILKPRTTKRYMELYASESVSIQFEEMEKIDQDIQFYVSYLKRAKILKEEIDYPIKLQKGNDLTRDSESEDQMGDQKQYQHVHIEFYESDTQIQEEMLMMPALIATPSS